MQSSLQPADANRSIYFKNRLDFSAETGYLFDNIPFVLNPLVNATWKTNPLPYTLVPFIFSVRWQPTDVKGPWLLRGNMDISAGSAFTAITRGPESRYIAFVNGFRYNFVQRRRKTVPYLDLRGGFGLTDAKGPLGVKYAQGQDLTFTFISGGGARYNFNPTYSLSAGIAYMHISNGYMSGPKTYNWGINVFGPTIGLNVALKRPSR